MIFTTLCKATLALFASSLILLSPQQAQAHSYADCIDWRFKDPRNPSWSDRNGACFGYARRFPLKAKPFAKLDSDSPNRHYQQSHKNPDPDHSLACSDGSQGEEPGADETMSTPISAAYNGKDKRGRKTGVQTISKPGGELCIRWPAKNHAVPTEKNQPVTIALSKVSPNKDPTQLQFLENVVAELNYKNCTDKGKNTDTWPCGGCFKLPTNLKPGNVVMQWRWKLNSNEFYTSCADINIEAPSITTSTESIPSMTTYTFQTPSSTSSASTLPTSALTLPTSASSLPTSASSLPTSASTLPSSASTLPTSASTFPTSASTLPSSAPTLPTSASTLPTSASTLPTFASTLPTSASSLPSSATIAPSTPQAPTSASSAFTSASHTAPSASLAPTSASQNPTLATPAPSAPLTSQALTSTASTPLTSLTPPYTSSATSNSQMPTSLSVNPKLFPPDTARSATPTSTVSTPTSTSVS